jgi:porin
VRGNHGFYFILDQMLYRAPGEITEQPTGTRQDDKSTLGVPGRQKSDRGLGVFGRVAFEPEDRNFIGFYFDTGMTYKGLIPSRNKDILGFAFAYAQLSSGAKQAGINDGSLGVMAEMALEATYQALITKSLGGV